MTIKCPLVDTNFNLLLFKSIYHLFAVLACEISTFTLNDKICIQGQTLTVNPLYLIPNIDAAPQFPQELSLLFAVKESFSKYTFKTFLGG